MFTGNLLAAAMAAAMMIGPARAGAIAQAQRAAACLSYALMADYMLSFADGWAGDAADFSAEAPSLLALSRDADAVQQFLYLSYEERATIARNVLAYMRAHPNQLNRPAMISKVRADCIAGTLDFISNSSSTP
jgi:hypothetical protein